MVTWALKKLLIHADKITHAMLSDGMLHKLPMSCNWNFILEICNHKASGIIAETMDGHRQFDNTLEARLHRLQDSLRSPVYHILMGETL